MNRDGDVPTDKRRRRNWIIVFVLLGVVAIALIVVGTITVVESMNGRLHVVTGMPAASTAAAAPVDEEETAAKQAVQKAAKGLTVGAVLTAGAREHHQPLLEGKSADLQDGRRRPGSDRP